MPLKETLCRRKPFVFMCLLILASASYLVFHMSGWTNLQQINSFQMQNPSSSESNASNTSPCVGNSTSCTTPTSQSEPESSATGTPNTASPASNILLTVLHGDSTASPASNILLTVLRGNSTASPASNILLTVLHGDSTASPASNSRIEGSSQPNTSQQDPGVVSTGNLANSTSCLSWPKNLSGQVLVSSEPITPEQLLTKYPYIELGGRLKPQGCLSDQKVSIIIPYRNRSQHLHTLLNNLIPILHRQLIDAVIFVVEQAPPTTFNRGSLFNIGFLESQKMGKFDCIILHDVDMIPTHDSCLYRCGDNPRHFISSINANGLPYNTYFGGVVGMKSEQYQRINGHSNLYFGWGGEDDDFFLRCQRKGYRHVRYPVIIGHYYSFKHQKDKGNEPNPDRFHLLRTTSQRQDIEGLNTVAYHVQKLEQRPLYTWILASVDMKQTLQSAPDYTKADMIYMLKSVQ